MAVQMQEKADGKVLVVSASGKLTNEDYDRFLPEVERLIDLHGKVRVLFNMENFHGWSAGGLWEDIKFDMKHFSDIERLAIVGDKAWEHGMAVFCRPFTTAKIRYFDKGDADNADAWIQADLPVTQPARTSAI